MVKDFQKKTLSTLFAQHLFESKKGILPLWREKIESGEYIGSLLQAPKNALHELQEVVKKIVESEIPLKDLCLRAKLNRAYEKGMPIHAKLAQKMKERDPNSAPVPGEHVKYIVIKNGSLDVSDRGEDPSYAERNGIKVDSIYYLERVKQAILKLFPPEHAPLAASIFENARHTINLKDKKQMNIFQAFGRCSAPLPDLKVAAPSSKNAGPSMSQSTLSFLRPSTSSVEKGSKRPNPRSIAKSNKAKK